MAKKKSTRTGKRLSKKDIFAKYGVELVDSKHIRTPLGNVIPLLMPVDSNSKVGDAATFSQWHGCETIEKKELGEKARGVLELAGIDEIKGSCPCHCKDCYCDKFRYTWDSNKASAIMKLILVRNFPEWVEGALIAQIESDGITQVRIHAQGDFDSERNCDIWAKVVNACPDCTFWTYTKNAYALAKFAGMRNLKVVPSVTPYGINFGTCAELLEMYHALVDMGYRVHICACGTDMEKHCSDCKTGCKAIGETCDFVLFIKHSTRDYKAGEKDKKEYNAICDIIRNQNN